MVPSQGPEAVDAALRDLLSSIYIQAPPPIGGADGYDSPEHAISRVPGFFISH